VAEWQLRDMLTSVQAHIRRPRLRDRLTAAAYDRLTAGLEREVYGPMRSELLHNARGRVLDIGAGTGANLPHFASLSDQVRELVLVDPNAGMLERAQRKASQLRLSVQLVDRGAEELPFADETYDTLVFALTLCTIPDPEAALREAHRVLRPQGRLLVLEHVRAREQSVARWQNRLNPMWKLINNGCHLNRDTRAAIERAGFEFDRLDQFSERRIPFAIVQPHLMGIAHKHDSVR
jgi:ubiquinone/menaquinone biosynthesis C-methylase UbiE